jgi:hypothetical protein
MSRGARGFEDVVAELGRDVVAALFPDELPVFAAVSRAYFADRERTLSGRNERGRPLGFGVTEAVAMMTPLVLWVVQTALEPHIVRTSDKVAGLLSQLRRKRPGTRALPILTSRQRAELREVVLDEARRSGMAPEVAAKIADEIIARLPRSTEDSGDP